MRVERQLRAKLSDWRGLLRGEVQEARQILRALLQDRIEFTPSEQDGHRIYRYRGTFTIGPLLAGVLDPQALASHAELSWNQAIAWLRNMAALRENPVFAGDSAVSGRSTSPSNTGVSTP